MTHASLDADNLSVKHELNELRRSDWSWCFRFDEHSRSAQVHYFYRRDDVERAPQHSNHFHPGASSSVAKVHHVCVLPADVTYPKTTRSESHFGVLQYKTSCKKSATARGLACPRGLRRFVR